jgi:hypothetical protein
MQMNSSDDTLGALGYVPESSFTELWQLATGN